MIVGMLNLAVSNSEFHKEFSYHHSAPSTIIENELIPNIVMTTPLYKKGSRGPFNNNTDSTTTYCNYSTYDVLEATGFHTDGLYNYKAAGTNANSATENLIQMAKDGKIEEIDGEKAQSLANDGYTVIVAWENFELDEEGQRKPGHLSTVRPSEDAEYDSIDGPRIANVGGRNGESFTKTIFSYGYGDNNEKKIIKYYYDEKQSFIYDITKMMIHLKGG